MHVNLTMMEPLRQLDREWCAAIRKIKEAGQLFYSIVITMLVLHFTIAPMLFGTVLLLFPVPLPILG